MNLNKNPARGEAAAAPPAAADAAQTTTIQN
ncbi:hypothetical protein RCH17_001606 [Arthrobacter sp. MP_M7]|nr:hypothetical protein [Arthrobacter sp. MP_M4]MEC5202800.1 hypothetical protein [Arthrobacter sp. MP_M7]